MIFGWGGLTRGEIIMRGTKYRGRVDKRGRSPPFYVEEKLKSDNA